MTFGIDAVLGAVTTVIDKIFPDKNVAEQAKLKVLEMQTNGELAQLLADKELALGQIGINLQEAKDTSMFVKGWRPFIGWTCGLAFSAKFLIGPFIFTAAQIFNKTIVLPPLDMSEMLPVLIGMLGLGAYRTYEKTRK